MSSFIKSLHHFSVRLQRRMVDIAGIVPRDQTTLDFSSSDFIWYSQLSILICFMRETPIYSPEAIVLK